MEHCEYMKDIDSENWKPRVRAMCSLSLGAFTRTLTQAPNRCWEGRKLNSDLVTQK